MCTNLVRLPPVSFVLAYIGVIPVADGEEEIDEYVLEYLSGYIGECHASDEDCSAFIEVRPSASRCPRSFATIAFNSLCVFSSHLICTSLCLSACPSSSGISGAARELCVGGLRMRVGNN